MDDLECGMWRHWQSLPARSKVLRGQLRALRNVALLAMMLNNYFLMIWWNSLRSVIGVDSLADGK